MKRHIIVRFFYIILFSFLGNIGIAQEICNNSIDDDMDGLVDLFDPDCNCELDDEFEYIPNGSFEEKAGCCSMLTDVTNCLEDWLIMQGTPDLYDVNCLDASGIAEFEMFYGIELTGTMINFGAITGFSETFGTCLNGTLEAGESYTFEAGMSIVDLLLPDPMTSGEFTIYGMEDCSTLTNFNYTDDPCTATAVELASFNLEDYSPAQWNQLALDFSPSVDINAIFIMINCNNSQITPNGVFIAMDSLSIKGIQDWTYEDSIVVNGNVCDFSFFLEVIEADSLSYQWYYNQEIIAGETGSSIELNGQNPTVEGQYSVIVTGSNSCYAIFEFDLIVPVISQEEFYTICPGDSVFVAGTYWDEAGTYTINYLDTISPCQIFLKFYIDEFPSYEFPMLDSMCTGDDYIFAGQVINTGGTYYDSMTTAQGCDSVYVLELLEYGVDEEEIEVSICFGDTLIFNGIPYTLSGTYTSYLDNIHGCDSTAILILNVDFIIEGDTNYVELEDGEYYLFNGDTLFTAGIYADTLTANGGCDSVDVVSLQFFTPCSIQANVESADPSCDQIANGYIDVIVLDNPSQYEYSIDGGASYFSASIFEDLSAGTYDIVIRRDDDCLLEYGSIELIAMNDLQASLPSEITIDVGDSISLSVEDINFVPDEYLWQSSGAINCDTCAVITVKPAVSTNYTLLLTDENGCTIEVQVLIVVREKSDIYLANTFSPNEDGVNDRFTIYGPLATVEEVNTFVIYDRWGNKVHEETDKLASELIGWDGKMNGTSVVQGVYAFYFQYDDIFGKNQLLKGSILLVR